MSSVSISTVNTLCKSSFSIVSLGNSTFNSFVRYITMYAALLVVSYKSFVDYYCLEMDVTLTAFTLLILV